MVLTELHVHVSGIKRDWLGERGEVREVKLLDLAIIGRLTEKRSLIDDKSRRFGPMVLKKA